MKKHKQAILIGGIYILAGIYHFVNPKFYLQIMPPYLSIHLQSVYLSGLAEIIAGGLLIPKKTRKLGVWCVVILLIAVLANIQLLLMKKQKGE